MTEYIDREKAENAINLHRCDTSRIEEAILHIPSVNAIPIPEGATNRDMIKAMFPNARVSEIFPIGNYDEVFYITIEKADGVTNGMRVMKTWWNAPYKRESEE